MSGGPKVSVCVPAYNAAAFIGDTVRSVLAQTFSDWELVVVDDRSTDGTADVVAGFADPRIRLIRNETNLGVAGNWTRATSAGHGEYLKVLCHDDVIYPESLARQSAVLEDPANAAVAVVSASRDILNATGTPIFRNRRAKGLLGRVSGPDALRAVVRSGTNPLGEPGALLFRRSVYEQVGGFHGGSVWMIDIDMWARLLGRGDLYVLPDTLSAFRVSGGALSTKLAKRQSVEAYELFLQLRQQHPDLIRPTDLAVGRVRAAVLQRLRSVVYGLHLRR